MMPVEWHDCQVCGKAFDIYDDRPNKGGLYMENGSESLCATCLRDSGERDGN